MIVVTCRDSPKRVYYGKVGSDSERRERYDPRHVLATWPECSHYRQAHRDKTCCQGNTRPLVRRCEEHQSNDAGDGR
jgi:hypothetical protein